MSSDLLRAQHRHAALMALGQSVMDRYLGTDGSSPQEQVICEAAPHQHRFVSQDVWFEVYALIQQHIQAEMAEIASYRVVRGATLASVRTNAAKSLQRMDLAVPEQEDEESEELKEDNDDEASVEEVEESPDAEEQDDAASDDEADGEPQH